MQQELETQRQILCLLVKMSLKNYQEATKGLIYDAISETKKTIRFMQNPSPEAKSEGVCQVEQVISALF